MSEEWPEPEWLDDYVAWIQTRCGDIWEGCYCVGDPGHSDDHRCVACDCTWKVNP